MSARALLAPHPSVAPFRREAMIAKPAFFVLFVAALARAEPLRKLGEVDDGASEVSAVSRGNLRRLSGLRLEVFGRSRRE